MNRDAPANILGQLDIAAVAGRFPDFDHPYVKPVTSQLRVYIDDVDCCIVLEIFGVDIREGWSDCIIDSVFFFGSKSLLVENGFELLYYPVKDQEDLFCHENVQAFNTDAKFVRVGMQLIDLSVINIEHLALENDCLPVADLLRELSKYYEDIWFCPEQEINQIIPEKLVKVLQLREWYHPRLSDGTLPSETETFKLIADVIFAGDSTLYQPTSKANTHWSNWPQAGNT
jgi:hypothetical protein